MRLLRSLEAILVSVGLVYCVSVDGISESLRASLQLIYKQRINETVEFFQFLSENFVHDIVGMSIDKIKLEIPRNPGDMATVNDTKGQDLLRVGRCSLQLSFQEEEGGELTVTGEHINELSIDQEQRKILLCAFVTIPIISEGSREYRTPTLVISTADPKWKTSSCENMTDSVCSEFNSTTKLTTSSKIFGSGKCCTIGLKIAYPLRIIQIFIITNQTEWLPLVSGRNARKGSAENENLFFVGEIPAIFKIVIVYEEEMSASFSIFWKNCNTIKRAISTTLSGWNYKVTDFTIYDEFCDCNEALLQPFYCDGPSKGLVLQTAGNLATITSEMITSSNPECYLSLVMTTTFRTYAGVTILSKNRTKFRVFSENREGGLYNHHSKEYRIKVGQIKEDFKIQVDLQRLQPSSLMAVGSIALNNCTGPHSFDSNCSSSEYMCKTGVCISKWKRCNIAKDCYHGDDEEHCGREISPWRCDFDDMPNSTCNFLQYENDKCGQFKVTEGRLFGHPGPEHTNTHDRGAMLYFQRNFCMKPFSAEIRTQLFEYTFPEKQENKSKCTLSIASKGENSCWWNLYLCQDSSCTRKLFRGNTTGIWRTDVVTLNLMSGSYYIKLKAKERCEWMAIDDVFFSPNCFSPEPEDLDITWWVEIFVPFVCLIVLIEIIVVSWAVCQKFSVCQKSVFLEKFYFLRSRKHSDMKDFLGDRCVLPNSTSRFKDMLTEDNPNYALLSERTLNECIRNIPFTSVCLESLLGEGSFGQVYKGKLIKHGETKEDLPIAIKKLPAGSFNENISDFLLEALTLGKFDHKNIVRCLGITSDPRGELLLILELMEGGDLRKYLRSHRQKEDLTIKELLKISLDIALGCQYLEENKFIHRDIAARNCLLSSTDSNKIAKIGDFGFAKDIYGTDYYKKSELTMVPVRWMPEESFKNGKFTSKSDVWAFGVLLWEVFSFGQLPYEDLTNCEVMAKVMNGHRLGQPKLCPIQLYTLMGDCWNTEPEKRPCFKTIVTIFTTLYTHSYAQSALTSNGICSLKVNGGKHRLNTYDEVDNAIPLLEGDCTIVSTTDDSVFEATIPV